MTDRDPGLVTPDTPPGRGDAVRAAVDTFAQQIMPDVLADTRVFLPKHRASSLGHITFRTGQVFETEGGAE